jgi:TatD DNase family protein
MPLIDTHAHLDDERLRPDIGETLERAQQAGLVHVLGIATTAQDSVNYLVLARQYAPFVRASVGIQPNHVAQAGSGDWDEVLRLAADPLVVALGETGLDRYWDYAPFPVQEDYFARHLDLSRKLDKPVVIHCRQAEADVVRMLKDDFDQHGPVRGVMHSFTGDRATAESCVAMGLFISFAGMLTYKNADDLRAVAAALPLESLLVETDCPYLAPVPVRGKRNEPAFVAHTAARLAELKQVPFEVLAEHTTRNARKLFPL